MLSLKSKKIKLCYVCKEYYSTSVCKICEEDVYNIVYRSSFVNKLFKKYNIPYTLYGKIMIVLSQIQNEFPLLHLNSISFLLYKILNHLGETSIQKTIIYVITDETIMLNICFKILCVCLTVL